MRDYFRYFKWYYILSAVFLLLFGLVSGGHWLIARMAGYQRENTECTTTERVFDYGDILTDKEEDKLRRLIAKREKQTGCDIVLVTLQESLKEYARQIDPSVRYDEFVRIYAEEFYESHRFGYDRPNGDGVLLVDNWYREDDGAVYTWLCTTGRVQETYSDGDIDHILDNVYRYVENDPYRAYKTYINDFYHDMLGMRMFDLYFPYWLPWAVGIIAAVIFISFNWKSEKGVKSTTAVTYVEGRQPQFSVYRDRFLRKTVTRHEIQTSSGGGGGSHSGGGGHSSGGGGSHGGGGHSR